MKPSQIILAAFTAAAVIEANWGLVILFTGIFLFTVIADYQHNKKA